LRTARARFWGGRLSLLRPLFHDFLKMKTFETEDEFLSPNQSPPFFLVHDESPQAPI